jgi:SAM-dependent methyltransferase
MTVAVNYRRWILDTLKPYLGKRCVEVGAGSGTFSSMLWESDPDQLLLVEPSAEMFGQLSERFQANSRIRLFNAMFKDVAVEIRDRHAPDSIIYLNVLEHVEHDEVELSVLFDTLGTGGHLLIFVPAMPFLMGPFDRAIGHFRRYAKGELERKCAAAGFRIAFSKYFDAMGVLPWWIKYRLFRSNSLNKKAVHLYDSYCVPLARRIESKVVPPIGKNVLLVAQKL